MRSRFLRAIKRASPCFHILRLCFPFKQLGRHSHQVALDEESMDTLPGSSLSWSLDVGRAKMLCSQGKQLIVLLHGYIIL